MLTTTTTNTRKRKSTGGLDASRKQDDSSNKRRKTLDAFFAPQVTIRSPEKEGKQAIEAVSLNAEQRRVLQMVVQEGKSVFFTGPAGTSMRLLLLSCSFAKCSVTKALASRCYCELSLRA